MNCPKAKMYSICNIDQEGNFINYNLPFFSMTDDYAMHLVFSTIKDVIDSRSFNNYSLVHIGYFSPDQQINCLTGCEEFNVIATVDEIIYKFSGKETKHE